MNDAPTWTGVLHAGIHGFLRSPVVRPDTRELAAATATHAVYGIPFDSTTLYRTGSMHGPKAVRDASAQFVSYHYDYDLDLAEHIRLVDCGDAAAVPGNAARTLALAQVDLEQIHAAGAMPIVLGGEHTVTIAATRALAAQRRGALGLVVFDTHLDTADRHRRRGAHLLRSRVADARPRRVRAGQRRHRRRARAGQPARGAPLGR